MSESHWPDRLGRIAVLAAIAYLVPHALVPFVMDGLLPFLLEVLP